MIEMLSTTAHIVSDASIPHIGVLVADASEALGANVHYACPKHNTHAQITLH